MNTTFYRQVVVKLIYLTSDRLDLSYMPSLFEQVMTSLKIEHWNAEKRILRYVKETLNFGQELVGNANIKLAVLPETG